MLIRKAALLGVLVFYAAPALAETNALYETRRSTPKTLTAFAVGNQPVEVMAVTRRARADTRFHKTYLDDCESMSKVYPGYPQPALVSFDLRVRF